MVTAAASKLIHEGAPQRDASTNGTTAFEAAPLTKPPAPRGVSDSRPEMRSHAYMPACSLEDPNKYRNRRTEISRKTDSSWAKRHFR
jgi:hypothetical protein